MEPFTFAAIAQSLRPQLIELGKRLLSSRDEAEDTAQEALVMLWRAWEQLPAEADARRMAVRLMKNACIDHLRSAHTRHTQPLGSGEMSRLTAQRTEHPAEERELRQALDRAANQLPPRERQLWLLHTEAGMGTAEVAAATGIHVRSVSVMLSTARRRIYETLKKGGYIHD